jgi:hypothetical protein
MFYSKCIFFEKQIKIKVNRNANFSTKKKKEKHNLDASCNAPIMFFLVGTLWLMTGFRLKTKWLADYPKLW